MATLRRKPTTPEWYRNLYKIKQQTLDKLMAISNDIDWDKRFFLWKERYCLMYAYQVKEAMKRIYDRSFSSYKKDEIFEYIKSLKDFDLLIKLFHIKYDMMIEKEAKDIQEKQQN